MHTSRKFAERNQNLHILDINVHPFSHIISSSSLYLHRRIYTASIFFSVLFFISTEPSKSKQIERQIRTEPSKGTVTLTWIFIFRAIFSTIFFCFVFFSSRILFRYFFFYKIRLVFFSLFKIFFELHRFRLKSELCYIDFHCAHIFLTREFEEKRNLTVEIEFFFTLNNFEEKKCTKKRRKTLFYPRKKNITFVGKKLCFLLWKQGFQLPF